MSGLGELIIIGIYVVLSIPIILTLIVSLLRKNKKKLNRLLYPFLTSIPLIIFAYFQYQNNKQAELKYVGIYYLTEYPNCQYCTLRLNVNNTYIVSKGDIDLENGKWNYRSGGDYWIVDLGDYGQLGSGKYRYTKYSSDYSKE
jgi:hypothetical protein